MAYSSEMGTTTAARPPKHPVPRLQAPFDESMAELVVERPSNEMQLDAVARRNALLEAPVYKRAVSGRWKQKPGEKYHPLWKLIAQISFGIHLLAEGLARSEDEVMQILQSHVDEIDGFLERTTEDLDLAQEDIQERLRCLKLPLSHPTTFDKMLEDRNFRLSIVNGNEKIEHIVDRTSQAMKDSLKDVQKGFDSTSCLETYLKELAQTWVRQDVEHEAVFIAMLGNVEGWRKAFMALHIQGSHLGGALKKLTDIINEMQRRAGEVSRRLLHQANGYSPTPDSRLPPQRVTSAGRGTPTSRYAPNKDLPGMPGRASARAASSHDSFRTEPSARASSTDSLAHLSQVSRSSTPLSSPPAPTNVNTSPAMSHVGQFDRGQAQSRTTSAQELRSSAQSGTTTVRSKSPDEDEPPERYFPPVELPAHVPEEAMSKAPLSKQNRLSTVLKPPLVDNVEKQTSKTPSSTLINLLKSNHILSKASSDSIRVRSTSSVENSPAPAPSVTKTDDTSGEVTSESPPVVSVSAPNDTKATARSARTMNLQEFLTGRNGKRKVKKGVKHWFDALDDESEEDGEICVPEEPPPEVKTTVVQVPVKSLTDFNNLPGTPAWATTRFTSPESRRAEMKFGAFGSHPSKLPPGSPPLAENSMPAPLAPIQPQQGPVQASGVTAPIEQGPEAVVRETSKPVSNVRPASDSGVWKRKSVTAPEVLSVDKASKRPARSLQFVAEMEGSMPSGPTAYEMPGVALAMELEAPQQSSRLSQQTTTSNGAPSTKLSVLSEDVTEISELGQENIEIQASQRSITSQSYELNAGAVELADLTDPLLALPEAPASTRTIEDAEDETKVLPNSENLPETELLLPAKAYAPTPQIPLPPSPAETDESQPLIIQDQPEEDQVEMKQAHEANEVEEEAEEEEDANQEATYLLPAVAYRAPSTKVQILRKALPTRIVPPEGNSSMAAVAKQPTIKTSTSPIDLAAQPSRATEIVEMPVPGISPTATILAPATFSEFVARGPPPEEVARHVRNRSSHGSHNGWKAFFTGQPSPAGSNLSIKSMRRESLLDDVSGIDPTSPLLLSSGLGSGRRSTPGSALARDTGYFSGSFEEEEKQAVRDMFRESSESAAIGLGLKV